MTLDHVASTQVDATPDLAELERVIERGLARFVEVGNALLTIKRDGMYREAGFATFEDYCRQRWGFSKCTGHRLIVAAATVEALARDLPELSPNGRQLDIPAIERQVRPLAKLPESERAEAWTEAVERAGGKQPTAVVVEKVVAERRSMRASQHLENVRDLAKLGLSTRAIASELGISQSRVWQITQHHDIPVEPNRTSHARIERIERTRQLAAEGATSQQIGLELGVTDVIVRQYAREHGIDLVADRVSRVRNISSTRIVAATIDALEGIDVMFDHIDYRTLPVAEIAGWVTVLDASLRSLHNLRKRLKEMTQP